MYIVCHASTADRQASRDRKGNVTQNCLVGCSFNMCFTYVLSGWHGSAADARIYHAARVADFTIPVGKCYLADAGFAACDELLVPYRSVHYHLAEWGWASLLYVVPLHGYLFLVLNISFFRPRNPKELYNLRHAMLCNVIEHIFGVLKKRFHILLLPPEFNMEIQARIPPALCLVHNVIRTHDPDDMIDYRHVESEEWSGHYNSGTLADSPPTEAACTRAHQHRDEITQSMWNDYNIKRHRRGLSVIQESD